MRYVFWLPIVLLAGTAAAQWKHFGESAGAAPASSSLAREMVVSHNAVRAPVGTPPLKWSGHLAEVAQQWADHLIDNGHFEHSHNPKYGENLYEIEGAVATPAEVVRAWAGEVKSYTTIVPIAATGCADTIRRSCGATRAKLAARWRVRAGAKFGYASTIRLAIGRGGSRISYPLL